jgi:hypothetical protein
MNWEKSLAVARSWTEEPDTVVRRIQVGSGHRELHPQILCSGGGPHRRNRCTRRIIQIKIRKNAIIRADLAIVEFVVEPNLLTCTVCCPTSAGAGANSAWQPGGLYYKMIPIL